ncbi:Unknown protein, partial [Striga hermonthica]
HVRTLRSESDSSILTKVLILNSEHRQSNMFITEKLNCNSTYLSSAGREHDGSGFSENLLTENLSETQKRALIPIVTPHLTVKSELRNNSQIMLIFFNVQMPPRREPDHQGPTQATVVAQFRDYHAEKFSGQGDPRIVDEWIQGLEFIFEVMECPDRFRVVCAQLQLTGDARLWWNAYWSMRPGEKAGCTRDMFKDLVRDKYYPSYYRAEMERQFLALQQGTRTVDEYEREFTRLAGFAPDL